MKNTLASGSLWRTHITHAILYFTAFNKVLTHRRWKISLTALSKHLSLKAHFGSEVLNIWLELGQKIYHLHPSRWQRKKRSSFWVSRNLLNSSFQRVLFMAYSKPLTCMKNTITKAQNSPLSNFFLLIILIFSLQPGQNANNIHSKNEHRAETCLLIHL